MIQLRNQGASLGDIAKVTGTPKASVHVILRDVEAMLAPPEQLERYREQQAGVMDTIGMVYGQRLLDEDAIKGASALQAATVLAIATDKSRLIRGESTQNHLVIHANAAIRSAESWERPAAIEAEVVDHGQPAEK